MNPGDDKTLQNALSRWQASGPLPPGFREHVWRRIAQAEAARPVSLGEAWRGWLETLFDRRAFALSYVTALLMLGLVAGFWRGRSEQAQAQVQLAERYVHTVAPYQTMP